MTLLQKHAEPGLQEPHTGTRELLPDGTWRQWRVYRPTWERRLIAWRTATRPLTAGHQPIPTHTYTHTHTHTQRVCVCVCVWVWHNAQGMGYTTYCTDRETDSRIAPWFQYIRLSCHQNPAPVRTSNQKLVTHSYARARTTVCRQVLWTFFSSIS